MIHYPKEEPPDILLWIIIALSLAMATLFGALLYVIFAGL
jgi:hypothetical protein